MEIQSSFIRDIIHLVDDNWRPYHGEVDPIVYKKLKCAFPFPKENPKSEEALSFCSPHWFNKGDIFLCISCQKQCTLSRPRGFESPLPIHYPEHKEKYSLSPQEMLNRLRVVTVGQAAYCLNVSRAQVYYWLGISQLRKLKEKPIRIPVEDIKEMLENIDE